MERLTEACPKRSTKRIVIACDGTWNRLDAPHPTNVAKLARAVAPVGPDGTAQVVCHLDGVGTGRGTGRLAKALDRALGGAMGGGLFATLAEAYRFLVFAYAPGDEIFLFGYSRGAYTARSLAGLVRNCGILERCHADAIPDALALYRGRTPDTGPDSPAALAFRAVHAGHVTVGRREAAWRREKGFGDGAPLTLAYVGAWDTVGALGVPGRLGIARWLNRGQAFHDTALSKTVAAARHAVAIDERRQTFPPTLWDNLDALNAGASGRPYAQRWFPGDHGSIGGGGAATALSDDTLAWVAEGAVAAGLALDAEALAEWNAGRDWRGPLLAAGTGPLRRLLALDSRDRIGPARLADLAQAAIDRWHADPRYRPGALARVASALGGAVAGPRIDPAALASS